MTKNSSQSHPIRSTKSLRTFPNIISKDKLHLHRIKELTIIGITWWFRITSVVLPLEDAGCRFLYEGLPKVWTLLSTRAEPHSVFPVEKAPRGRPKARPPQNQQSPTEIKSLDFRARRRWLLHRVINYDVPFWDFNKRISARKAYDITNNVNNNACWSMRCNRVNMEGFLYGETLETILNLFAQIYLLLQI